jgi:hypothetical protein
MQPMALGHMEDMDTMPDTVEIVLAVAMAE